MNKTKERFSMYGGILIVGLILFLIFNVSTTIDTFKRLFGESIPIVVLGFGFSLIDFSGLARAIAPDVTNSEEDATSLRLILTVIWIVAATADFWLTMVWGRFGVASTKAADLVGTGVLSSREANSLPFMIAAVEATIRIPLVFALSNYGERVYKMKQQEKSESKNLKPKPKPDLPSHRPESMPNRSRLPKTSVPSYRTKNSRRAFPPK